MGEGPGPQEGRGAEGVGMVIPNKCATGSTLALRGPNGSQQEGRRAKCWTLGSGTSFRRPVSALGTIASESCVWCVHVFCPKLWLSLALACAPYHLHHFPGDSGHTTHAVWDLFGSSILLVSGFDDRAASAAIGLCYPLHLASIYVSADLSVYIRGLLLWTVKGRHELLRTVATTYCE